MPAVFCAIAPAQLNLAPYIIYTTRHRRMSADRQANGTTRNTGDLEQRNALFCLDTQTRRNADQTLDEKQGGTGFRVDRTLAPFPGG